MDEHSVTGRRYRELSERELMEKILDLQYQLLKESRDMAGDYSKIDQAVKDIGDRFDGIEAALQNALTANAAGDQAATDAAISEALNHISPLQQHVDTVTAAAQAQPVPAAGTGTAADPTAGPSGNGPSTAPTGAPIGHEAAPQTTPDPRTTA